MPQHTLRARKSAAPARAAIIWVRCQGRALKGKAGVFSLDELLLPAEIASGMM